MSASAKGLAAGLALPTSLTRTRTTLDTVEEALASLAARYHHDDVLTAIKHIPARAAQFRPMRAWVRPELAATYRAKGIEQLYSHQAAAAELARAGKDFVVVTPTASGKTLCYNLPVLNAILENSDTRALYLFPTKALAQDQLAELHDLATRLNDSFGVFTYDGDTPADARKAIRERSHVVLTNPDMLHTGILPHHTKWTRVFENLRYIVLDELHTYRGVFGSHLSNVLRRLARIANFYGSRPQFICCSATIANPGELAGQLTEREVLTIEENGAPAAEKLFVFYNPPMVNRNLGIRRSYLNETTRVAKELLARKLQTIVFANSRLHTEVLLTYLQQANPPQPGAPEPIRGYRGGYLPGERREIERGLREGRVRGVVTTNALELGIDIGSLDACVMAGYAGSIASTWQRAGRAGRRSGTSCAVLVASSAPLDQFIVQHPDYFFGRSPEHAYVQPDNLEILVNHLKCAAFELPIAPTDRFGDVNLQDLCERLAEAGFLHRSGGNWHWTQEAYPADTISLRSVTSDNFVIILTSAEDDGNISGAKKGVPEVIGEVDFSSALTTVHPKAIYLHQGQQYHVEKLDFDQRKAWVRPVSVEYYTDAIRYTQVRVLEIAEESPILNNLRQGTASCPEERRAAVPQRNEISGVLTPEGSDASILTAQSRLASSLLSFRAEGPDAFAPPDEVRSGPAERNLLSPAFSPGIADSATDALLPGSAARTANSAADLLSPASSSSTASSATDQENTLGGRSFSSDINNGREAPSSLPKAPLPSSPRERASSSTAFQSASPVPSAAPPKLSFRAEGPDALAPPDEVRSGPAERNLLSPRQGTAPCPEERRVAVPQRDELSGVLTPEATDASTSSAKSALLSKLSFRTEGPDAFAPPDKVRSGPAERNLLSPGIADSATVPLLPGSAARIASSAADHESSSGGRSFSSDVKDEREAPSFLPKAPFPSSPRERASSSAAFQSASPVPSAPPPELSFRAEGPDAFAPPDEVRSGPAERNLLSPAFSPGIADSATDPFLLGSAARTANSAADLLSPASSSSTASSAPDQESTLGGRSFSSDINNEREAPSFLPKAPFPSSPRERASSFAACQSASPVPATRAHGDVLVRSQVIGFKKIKFFTNENVGDGKLELPENEMHTTAFWITLERELLAALPFALSDRQTGILGLLYAMESIATLLLMCDRRDLGTAVGERPPDASVQADWQEPATAVDSPAEMQEFFEPNLYLYDAYPGGIGFSEPLYRVHDLLLRRTRELIASCPCDQGCPSCVGPAGEKSERTKEAALAILERLCPA